MPRTRSGRQSLCIVLALLAAACGGETSDVASTPDPAPAATQPAVTGGGGCPVDACDDGLLPELAGIPMPDFVEAYAYGVPDRTDGLATQQVFLGASAMDAAEFFDAELAAAGFQVNLRVAEGDEYFVDFTDPQGRPGSISINRREFHPVVMDVGLQVA